MSFNGSSMIYGTHLTAQRTGGTLKVQGTANLDPLCSSLVCGLRSSVQRNELLQTYRIYNDGNPESPTIPKKHDVKYSFRRIWYICSLFFAYVPEFRKYLKFKLSVPNSQARRLQ